MSAPASSSAAIAPGVPVRAAAISTVSPDSSAAFGSAPASSSAATNGGVAVGRRQPDRRRAVVVGRAGVGPGREQALHRLQVVVVGGPVERRRAVGLPRTDIRALRQQFRDGSTVTAADGLDQVRRFRGGTCGEEERRRGGPQPRGDPNASRVLLAHRNSSCFTHR